MKVLIVVPTYNEQENVDILAQKIREISDSWHLLFVDDNSPDQTAAAIRELPAFGQSLFLLERPSKMGLASAYLEGFAWGLERDYEVIVQMDADLSHRPEDLLGLIDRARDHDLVIGSRYTPGGNISNWPRRRRFISRGGSTYGRLVLNMPVRDLTGGFNAWRAAALRRLDTSSIRSEGYSFQIELKHLAHETGLSYTEEPIVFDERRSGQSKISKRIIWEAFWRVWLMRFFGRRTANLRKFVKFIIVGFGGLIIDAGGTIALVEWFGWHPVPATSLAFVIAAVNNYFWNKFWTFRDADRHYGRQFVQFLLVSTGGLILNAGGMWLLIQAGVYYVYAKLILAVAVAFYNFVLNNIWTFRRQKKI